MSRNTDDVETKASARLPGQKPATPATPPKPKLPREHPTERLDPNVIGPLVRAAVKRKAAAEPVPAPKPGERRRS